MLYELFSWVINEHNQAIDLDHTITKVDWLRAYDEACQKERKTLAQLRAIKFAQQSVTTVDEETLKMHRAYVQFLSQGMSWFSFANELAYYEIALFYFCERTDTNQSLCFEKMAEVFTTYWQENPVKGLALYTQFVAKWPSSVHNFVLKERINAHIQSLDEHLQEEKNPQAIAQLMNQLIDDTEQFAAALIWLIRRGVSPEALIKTGLLDSFIRYNFYQLNAEDSPITGLYSCLQLFPEAHELILLADKVRCNSEEMHLYSLKGSFSKDRALIDIEREEKAYCITASITNYLALNAFFGRGFLSALIRCDLNELQMDKQGLLSDLFNVHISLNELAECVRYTAETHDVRSIKNLSHLLTEDRIQALISARKSEVLCLLVYRRSLPFNLTAQQIQAFLDGIKQSWQEPYDAASLLISLLLLIQHQEKHSVRVYQEVISFFADNRSLMDDALLIGKLRSFPNRHIILEATLREYESSLLDNIRQQVAKNSFSLDDYHQLEDIWLSVSKKMTIILELEPQCESYFKNKYYFQALIVQALVEKNPSNFNLKELTSIFDIDEFLAKNEVNAREYLLIEILAQVDKTPLRQAICIELQKKYGHDKKWVYKKYGAYDLLTRAAYYGNQGLLAWLIEQKHCPISGFLLKKFLLEDAEKGLWNVVYYFVHLAQAMEVLDLFIVKKILPQAAEQGCLELVTLFFQMEGFSPRQTLVEQAFMRSVETNQGDVVHFLCTLQNVSPRKNVLIAGMKRAQQLGHLHLISFITDVLDDVKETCHHTLRQIGDEKPLYRACFFRAADSQPTRADSQQHFLGRKQETVGY